MEQKLVHGIVERLWANEPPVIVEQDLPLSYDEPMPIWLGHALLLMPTVEAAYTFLKIWLRPEELAYPAQAFFYHHATGQMNDHTIQAAFEVFARAAYQNHPIFETSRRKKTTLHKRSGGYREAATGEVWPRVRPAPGLYPGFRGAYLLRYSHSRRDGRRRQRIT